MESVARSSGGAAPWHLWQEALEEQPHGLCGRKPLPDLQGASLCSKARALNLPFQAREMAQQVKILVTKTASLSLVPGTHGGRREPVPLNCPLTTARAHTHTHTP